MFARASEVTTDGSPIIEARGVTKTYDTGTVQVNALKNVGLTIRRGEMVSIMGPSGCGKTTLLNCLSGLDAVDEGEILIEGGDLSKMSDRERTDYRARRMGFVFQFYNLMPVLTARRERRAAAARRAGPCERGATQGAGRPRPRSGSRGRAEHRPGRALRRRAPARRPSRAPWSTTRQSSGPTSPPATSTARTPPRSAADASTEPEHGLSLRDRHPRPDSSARAPTGSCEWSTERSSRTKP